MEKDRHVPCLASKLHCHGRLLSCAEGAGQSWAQANRDGKKMHPALRGNTQQTILETVTPSRPPAPTLAQPAASNKNEKAAIGRGRTLSLAVAGVHDVAIRSVFTLTEHN